jgi:valyl-tRNA synthetase
MDIERDEMFRITSIKMSQWSLAAKRASSTATSAVADAGGKGKKGPKADKPNPCQPSKKKEEKPKKESTFVADNTPFGEKKDCTLPMLPEYHPKSVEAAWYAWWEKKGFFHADEKAVLNGQKVFTMVIPPPNVTGALHLGHALMLSIQDAIVRYKRMQGY